MMPATHTPTAGSLVHVRSRRWLVDEVIEHGPGQSPLVRLACADDDAQGQVLEVYWNHEIDGWILDEEAWHDLGAKGFDPPDQFAAYVHTLGWNCVTATDPNLFQAPFRAGIKIDAYQMEPLRKALQLPRVNLFIADDTGLGKTIEAGLIARELLLRKKVKTIVVAAPPSVLEQWQGELEDRFGLVFEILDRAFFARVRRERGFGVNPWRTHSRFLVSHNLLIDPAYTDPLREWLGPMQPGSLLILDEAHHAAPSSGGRYGIETKFTRAIRDLAGRFEHRLFLSATPHNGHSSSFSTLMELLDPYRFTRGVKVRGKRTLDAVMVRRLKEDIRSVQGGFPQRLVIPIVIDNLPGDAPEIALSRLLDEYRQAREARFASASRGAQASAGLLVVGLQQRLLSSIEAFARSLAVHRKTVERQWAKATGEAPETDEATFDPQSFLLPPDADDERATLSDEELDAEDTAQVEAVTRAAERHAGKIDDRTQAMWQREQVLLQEMQTIADRARTRPEAKLLKLVDWIREHMVPGLPEFGSPPLGTPAWNHGRLLLFTENREGTKRYLRTMLEQAIAGSDRAEERIEVIDGLTSGARRKEIQQRFNTRPEDDPLRILIATDAAREGLNFQAHCTDLIHYDLPWNPGRIEQRNGRIDRKLQPADVVRCHYFVLPQRVEDRVLQVLVNKTETIRRELGSLARVIDADLEKALASGIRHTDADALARQLEQADLTADAKATTMEELEVTRDRQDDLKRQIARCQELLFRSQRWVDFDRTAFRHALGAALDLLGAPPLQAERDEHGDVTRWRFPALDARERADASWTATLDTLRVPRKRDQKITDWRREAPIRPVVFEDAGILTDDVVHLHLEQRVAQRLLARFRAQGFVHHDLSRAVLATSDDAIPRVVLLGRLSLYGHRAERLHEEIVPVTARWLEPSQRQGPLQAFAREGEQRTLDVLRATLTKRAQAPAAQIIERLQAGAAQDVADLRPQLERRATEVAASAIASLHARGQREAKDLTETLQNQRKRVFEQLEDYDRKAMQPTLGFSTEERAQLDAHARAWRERLTQFEHDLDREPDRIRTFYDVRASRIEPVGLAYLWPASS
jgi:superfamily II DNA or RNA helicase